jgi:exopolyphosphatase/pppGpp-phosphohydrolase
MTTLHVGVGHTEVVFADRESGACYTVPVGSDTLAALITADPPLPEELTNAIGLFLDHLEDVTREVPNAAHAEVIEVRGPGGQALVDTELGRSAVVPCTVGRDAIEEVFRTLATESAADRALNPGLPAEEVHHILGVCCVAVALLRGLQASELTVTHDPSTDDPSTYDMAGQ